jgi:UDP-N-acetylmuramate-alanine ligase
MKLPPKLGPIHFIGIGGIGMSGHRRGHAQSRLFGARL